MGVGVRSEIFSIFVSIILAILCFAWSSAEAEGFRYAPGAPGVLGTWSRPDKDGFGTTLQRPLSFTIANGVLSEIHYPLIDRLQSRDTRIVVRFADGQILDERGDFESQTKRIPGTLAYSVTSQSRMAKIEKKIMLAADQDGVLVEYDIVFRERQAYEIILIHNPASESTPGGDTIYVSKDSAGQPVLVARQIDLRGDEPETLKRPVTQAIQWSLPTSRASVGFEGANAPDDLLKSGRWPSNYDRADYGNVAGALAFEGDRLRLSFKVAISFSNDRSVEKGTGLLRQESSRVLESQRAQWGDYLAPLKFDKTDMLTEASVLVVKGLEDKFNRGALIAAPAVPALPWFGEAPESNYEDARRRWGDANAGYNRVWPRDLFHKALALLSVDDRKTPVSILQFYRRTQKSEGWWAQNMWVDGTPSWGAMQLDQAALPIVLAARLVEAGLVSYDDYDDMVNRAASFVSRTGPWTDQERWEEIGGLSSNSLAAAVDGLLAAAWLEEKAGHGDKASAYRAKANEWRANLKKWTLIANGKFGSGYFARIERGSNEKKWDPSKHEYFRIANKRDDEKFDYREDEILDGGFLQWILAGLVDPKDGAFTNTLKLYDRNVRKMTSAGNGYLRYNYDAYGEFGKGGAWPILSAERAIVALESRESYDEHVAYVTRSKSSGDMLGEQDTLAVRPLGWTHAAWLILKKSVSEGRSFYIAPHLR